MTSHASRRPLALVSALLVALVVLSCPAVSLALDSQPDVTEAKAAIVTDSEGNVLWSSNADEELPMASITKIMTAIVALDSGIPMDRSVTVSDLTLQDNAQVAGFTSGTTTTFGDLMKVMLVYSANDAATYIGRAVAGSDDAFVDLMNKKAAELGMDHTHFVNAHGLDADGHHSSVADLAKMARYAMTNYPFIRQWVHTSPLTIDVSGTSKTFETTDELMGVYSGLLGIKTGAGDTGYTFLGCSRRDGVTLYTCVLGCSTKWGRFQDTENIMDWAYDTYEKRQVADDYAYRVVPFAYHFGLSCVVSADTNTFARTWPDLGDCTYTTYACRSTNLAVPSAPYGATLWEQSGRVVAACSYSTSSTLVRTVSFGPFVSRLFDASAIQAAA